MGNPPPVQWKVQMNTYKSVVYKRALTVYCNKNIDCVTPG